MATFLQHASKLHAYYGRAPRLPIAVVFEKSRTVKQSTRKTRRPVVRRRLWLARDKTHVPALQQRTGGREPDGDAGHLGGQAVVQHEGQRQYPAGQVDLVASRQAQRVSRP